jgi:3-hexulose-6-phosphate synthase/6-phospho-3-hexuloisomerase
MWEKPILQVALDYSKLIDAAVKAYTIHDELNDVEYILEAGTPLIKYNGLVNVIPMLKDIVGDDTCVLADLKTMDTGAFEVQLACNTGADLVAIAGAAEEETIEAALIKAEELHTPVMIDSIGVRNIKHRLDWIIDRIKDYEGNAILEYHIPVDKKDNKDFSIIKEIYESSGIPLAAAGGLDENTVVEVLEYGAKICVIGRAITQPINRTPEEAIRKIKEAVYS